MVISKDRDLEQDPLYTGKDGRREISIAGAMTWPPGSVLFQLCNPSPNI